MNNILKIVLQLIVIMFFVNTSYSYNREKGNINNLDTYPVIDITDRGAIADGNFDNHEIIQKVIDSLCSKGGGTIYFPSGVYAIYDDSIVIWGDNIKLQGENIINTKIIKKGTVGFFGDCLDICGKISGYQYIGNFGKGDYARRYVYRGKTIKSNNIEIENLIIDTDLDEKSKVPNGLGVLNSNNVKMTNCRIINSPQTNVAIVNETFKFSNGFIRFENCSFENSGRHNVRVISYNQGDIIGNNIEFFRCRFLTTLNKGSEFKELVNKKVLLWYRGGVDKGITNVKVDNCFFDDSGIIFLNGNTNGFSIKNSKINSALHIQHSPGYGLNPKITIEGNTFFKNDKFKTPFIKDNFYVDDNIYIYPKVMKYRSKDIIVDDNNFK